MVKPVYPAELEAAKGGDEAALAAIIARYLGMVRFHARRSVVRGLEFDDAVQEGIIGLFRAIQQYSPINSASFSTFASACIRNSILSAQKAAERKKHAPLNHSIPIPEEQSIPGPEEQAILNEQLSHLLEKARAELSSFEKAVLLLYINGYSYKDIAHQLNKQPKSIENALSRLRKKLR